MTAMRAVLISDATLDPQPAAQSVLSRHAWVKIGMTICLHDWLDGPMLLSPDQGDLAVVALTDVDQQLPKLALQTYRRPFPISTVVTADPSTVFIVGAVHDGPFMGSRWVDASSVGIDSAIEHLVAPAVHPCHQVKVMNSFAGETALSARQAVIVFLLTNGLTGQEAGQLLGISEKTVSCHKRRIMDKLGIGTFPDLVRIADHNSAGLLAVSESWLGWKLDRVIHAHSSGTELKRLRLKRAPGGLGQ
jgi:DNA-binding CsgD family transcriptional regulator